MISRAQQILLKRAQKQAGVDDADYRTTIADCTGLDDCRSSTDPRLTDRHLDVLMSYFEAIHWRAVDSGLLPAPTDPGQPFRARGYWAGKNTSRSTSRDRYVERDLAGQVAEAEAALHKLGYGLQYCAAIRNNIVPFSLPKYLGALSRTIHAKQAKAAAPAERPF